MPEGAPIPERMTLAGLRRAAANCRACDLWDGATQTVFGEGLKKSLLMLVGETPGDHEDKQGKPFVGPAGRVLHRALKELEIDRKTIYLTNAVKHFRYEERGKRRIHQRPSARHIDACRPWLEAELDVVKPRVLVLMGAVAAESLLGSEVRVTRDRGHVLDAPSLRPATLVTVHPSSILRSRDSAEREEAFTAFTDDLRVAAKLLGSEGCAT